MPQDQIQTVSTSTIKIESTARITLTPSDLELLFLEYVQMGLLFPHPHQTTLLNKNIVHHLKDSLELTLHFFPTLVGRLATARSDDGSATCFFLDCGHRDGGVVFIHAETSGLTVADVNESSNSGPGVVPSLFPLAGVYNKDGASHPLLAVQVTDLADGLFVGWTVNHLVADGTAFWHFLNSWAEISRGAESISKLPILSRDQVNLDLVGARDIYIRDEHLAMNENISADQSAAELSERVFRLTKEKVAKLKARANEEMEGSNGKISSLQAVIAHLWRSIIRCRSVAALEETTFEIPMGARQRMSPPLPDEYFGNAVFPGIVTLNAGKVAGNGLGWTAWQINRMVASANGAEKVKEFYSSWAKEPKFLQFDAIPTNHFILINSPRFDVYGNDFGWGPPVAARSGRGSSFDGRITVSAGLDEGSLDVEVCLLKETLSAMAEDVEFMEFVTVEN
ncbi:protein ENHANCED PSEUDOMONAS SUSCEPTIBILITY 1-like [Salvia miltiorrhiza]|uniref:protein ENHANCED PSEUDOMONAS SUSCEPTIBILITY 1-like n=1 Tax=Salvia miltiorrhiza TaxID=226208 RepID=UPI0025AD083D|nr:protein ENHANCED PSEUDOMONAS SUSCEPTIBILITY 1-like [Salvia miltiorrhiza]